MKLKLGEQNAILLCQYTSVSEVIGGIFSDGKDKPAGGGDFVDLAQGPTFESAIANINQALMLG